MQSATGAEMHDSVVPVASSTTPLDRRLKRAVGLCVVLLAGSLWAGATWGRDLAGFIISHVRLTDKVEAKEEVEFGDPTLGPRSMATPDSSPGELVILTRANGAPAARSGLRMLSFADPATPAIVDLSRPLPSLEDGRVALARWAAANGEPAPLLGRTSMPAAHPGGFAGAGGAGAGGSAAASQPDAQPPLDLKPLDPSALAPIAPAPEPSNWALMVLGFGLTGAGLRRVRRRRQR